MLLSSLRVNFGFHKPEATCFSKPKQEWEMPLSQLDVSVSFAGLLNFGFTMLFFLIYVILAQYDLGNIQTGSVSPKSTSINSIPQSCLFV